MRCCVLIALLIWFTPRAYAGNRISTYMEGTLIEKSIEQWVIETKEGVYWIKLTRPLSWIRRTGATKVSFWVRIDQIKRFRPVKTLSAAAERP